MSYATKQKITLKCLNEFDISKGSGLSITETYKRYNFYANSYDYF